MRRLVVMAVAGAAWAVPVGCCTTYVNNPPFRQDQLLEQSETLRLGEEVPERVGGEEAVRPETKTVRIHSGIL